MTLTLYLNYPKSRKPSVNIVAVLEEEIGPPLAHKILIEHNGGEPLPLTAKPKVAVDGMPIDPSDIHFDPALDNGDDYWNIGERYVYSPPGAITEVEIIVVDPETNSIIMMGVLEP